MSTHRHIVSRHLLRSAARESQRRLNTLQRESTQGFAASTARLIAKGIKPTDHLTVERAGRLRARWVVVASR